VEVAKHLIGAPATKESDAIGVDVRAEKGHGPGGAKGASRDIVGKETVSRTKQADGGTEEGREVGRGHSAEAKSERITVGSKGLCGRGGSRAEVEEPTSGRRNRTEQGITAAPEADDFAADTIFLIGKFKSNKGGGKELGRGGSGSAQTDRAQKQVDVAGAERLSGRRRAGVLAGPKEKEETEADHVGKGAENGVGSGVGLGHDVAEDRDRDGFDTLRGRVGARVASELALEAVIDFALWGEARIRGPHTRKRLANAA